MDWSAIGKKIKERRKECKITQAELAEKIGKTESSIRKYEKGLVAIPTDVIEKIAEMLETTPYTLFGTEWFDIKLGPDIVDELQKSATIHQGMMALLYDLYGCAETKEVIVASGWCRPYFLIGTPPNSFILHEGDGDLTAEEDLAIAYYTEDEHFADLMDTFLWVMGKAYKSGGLYCDGLASRTI